MKKNFCILFSILLIVLYALSCATVPEKPVPPIQNNVSFKTSFDDVWKVVIDVISDYNFSIEALEKDSGIITTNPFSYTKMTTGGLVSVGEGCNMRLNIRVSKDTTGTNVKINSISTCRDVVTGGWYSVPIGYEEATIVNNIMNEIGTRLENKTLK